MYIYLYKQICDKYNVKGCQKSLSHPCWPPNTVDMTLQTTLEVCISETDLLLC